MTVGLWAARRFPARDVLPYIVAQVVGGIIAGGVLYAIASGQAGFSTAGGFASNGYGEHSPGQYSLAACAITEVVMTLVFIFIIAASTDKRAIAGFAPIPIGLSLTLIHLISIPVTNTSVNPARSTGVAIYVGGWAIAQLWLFWVAPIVGGAIGGKIYDWLFAPGFRKPRPRSQPLPRLRPKRERPASDRPATAAAAWAAAADLPEQSSSRACAFCAR